MRMSGYAVLAVVVLLVAVFLFMRSNNVFWTRQAGAQGLISPADYQSQYMQAKAPHLLLDVRTAEEFAAGHIPGAKNISLQSLDRRLGELPKDQPIIVYCRSGSRSATAAQLLKRQGFEDVRDLGGIITWQRQGLPVN